MGGTITEILLALGSWIVAGLVTYGVMKQKITDFLERVKAMEVRQDNFIPRSEYEKRHEDLSDRVERIENKVFWGKA